MHALSPRISPSTIQSATQLPTDIANIISSYTQPDFSMALADLKGPLDTGSRTVVQQTKNGPVLAAIKEVLISSQCDPKIKRLVLIKHFVILPHILKQVHDQGYQINLDDTDLSGLNIGHLDLSRMTAKNACFAGSKMTCTDLNHADLSGANFFRTQFDRADLSFAILKNTRWIRTAIVDTNMAFCQLWDAKIDSLVLINCGLFTKAISASALQSAVDQHTNHGIIFSWGGCLNGIYSSAHGFRPACTEALNLALRAIQELREDTDPNLGFR